MFSGGSILIREEGLEKGSRLPGTLATKRLFRHWIFNHLQCPTVPNPRLWDSGTAKTVESEGVNHLKGFCLPRNNEIRLSISVIPALLGSDLLAGK